MINKHVGRFAVGVEQSGLVQEADEVLGFFEHLVEIVVFDHHLGRVQFEIDLVEVPAPPAGQVAVDIGPLVVDGSLAVVAIRFDPDDAEPLGEPLFQLRACNLVVLFTLRFPVGSCVRAITTYSLAGGRDEI
jgi:hypothetical protein